MGRIGGEEGQWKAEEVRDSREERNIFVHGERKRAGLMTTDICRHSI